MQLVKAENVTASLDGLANLPAVRQLGVMFGIAAAVALGVAIVLWGKEPNWAVLYTGLSNADTGVVVENLRTEGVKYKLDEQTGALMVPADKVHELRLSLASTGIPRSAGIGFDILEKKQEFGTSEFMETARYHRALEGELAQSITSIGAIESTRVHLALPKQSVFVRKRQQPSASVVVNLFSGRTLAEEQVAAITHLVASSIPNMEPVRVTVVDQRGRLLSAPKRNSGLAANQEQFEYTRRLEDSYVQRIESILTPVLGLDGVRAQVALDMDFNVTEKTEETYNPDLPAPRSEQLFEERLLRGETGGVPGALSNQPPGESSVPEVATGEGAETAGEPTKSVKRSTVNYELDRTISHTRMASGVVKRLSVAVVVDDRITFNEEGEPVREPRSEEEIERLTSLVRDAVGYSPQRGDTVNVINASFAPVDSIATADPEPPLWKQVWVWENAKTALAYLMAALLGMTVLRQMMKSLAQVRPQAAGEPVPALAGAGEARGGLAEDQVSITGSSAIGTQKVRLPAPDMDYEENLNQARQMAMQDPGRVAQVVRSWVHADDSN